MWGPATSLSHNWTLLATLEIISFIQSGNYKHFYHANYQSIVMALVNDNDFVKYEHNN